MDKQELLKLYTQGDRIFAKIDLSGADLSWQDLSGADFTGADFYGAILRGTQLAHTNFSQANLAHANLQQANLAEANLSGAEFNNVDLEDTHLQSAIYDEQTIFPYGFDPIAAGCLHAKDIKPPPPVFTTPEENSLLPIPSSETPSETFAPTQETFTPVVSVTEPIPAPTESLYQPPISATPQATPRKSQFPWVILGAIAVVFGGWLAFRGQNSPINNNPFNSVSFPLKACGDPIPAANKFPANFYPVYVSYSSDNLAKVRTQYCRDAYPTNRKDTGHHVVQVASFTTASRAQNFAAFMTTKLGSAEVGSPRQVKRIDDL